MSFNLNDPRHPWPRLTAAARTVRDDHPESAPYGFATRIAALALAQEQRVAFFFDRIALRALGVACLLAVFSVAVNYGVIAKTVSSANEPVATSSDDLILPTSDAVAVVLDLAD